VAAPSLDRDRCRQEVEEAFGEQDASLIVLRPRDHGSVFRPQILEAIDGVCQAFEDAMTDDLVSLKCITSLPIMEGRPTGTRVVIARDEFPMSPAEASHFQLLVHQLEFSRGDVIDIAGVQRSFIHLPHASFDGVDIAAIFEEQVSASSELLELALDDGSADRTASYRALAEGGPSSHYLVGLFDSGEAGGLKEPSALLALESFQAAAEVLPRVAQSFSIVDDLKMVRRGLHRGNPGDALIPPVRAEVAQLLLALSMAPAASAFGPRIDSEERVALVRINLASVNRESRLRIARRLDSLMQGVTPPGARGLVCVE